MTQLRQVQRRLDDLEIDVVVVTFDAASMARDYVEQTQLPWPLLIDSERELYRAYGMLQAGWANIYSPASIWRYMQLIFGHGRRIETPGSDQLQLGGDVLVGPDGMLKFQFVSTSPHDRPSVATILAHRN